MEPHAIALVRPCPAPRTPSPVRTSILAWHRAARIGAALVLVSVAAPAQALTPEKVLELAGASLVRVALLDEQGAVSRQGSGVVVRPGEVIANCNAVAGNAPAIVVYRDGRWALAQLVGTDVQRNLCHLRWRGDEPIGQPVKGIVPIDKVRKGQVAYAVGSPRGLDVALSGSLVAGFHRHPERGMVIDTDTPIAPEASGGGLFDRDGHLIGFTAMVLADGQKLDFAVPAGAAFDLVPGLRSRRAAPLPPPPKEERADRDHLARLQAESDRLAEARRFLETERARAERDRQLAEQAQARTSSEPVTPDVPPASVEVAPAPAVDTAPPAPPVLLVLPAIAERVERALAGSPIGARFYSLDVSLVLDAEGRILRLKLDRTSGNRAVDNTVTSRIAKGVPYRDTADGAREGPLELALRVGWFHDHPTVIAMAGALPPFAATIARGGGATGGGPSPGEAPPAGPQPDEHAQREARELAKQQLRIAEEQRALRRKAEAEQLVQANDDARRTRREAAEAEGRTVAAAASQALRVVEEYTVRVSEAISRQFLIPEDAPVEARAEIEFRVLPNGQAGALRFLRKSGNVAFDRAIEAAVERARPLPVPTEPAAYLQFRDQRLVFTGER